jgi:D-alanyl-D-alanine carboxypeptidase
VGDARFAALSRAVVDAGTRRSLSRRRALQVGGAGLATSLVGPGAATAGQAQDATPEPVSDAPFSPARQLALTAIVLDALAATSTPGALAGVWVPDQGSWTMAAGIGDLETAAPMRPDDHFRIASITKTFVATVVLQLVEEGKLSLDDHLERFISGIPNGDVITIRQLLNMTAGIYNYIYDPVIAVDYDRDPLLPFMPEQAVAIVRAHGEADFAPGTRTLYSDTNYILLGLILEQVTARTVAAEITERIIVPLGLTQTSFAATPEMPEPYAHGYAAERAGVPLRDVTRSTPDVPWAAGAMISTMGDLRTWADALVAGTLLSPAMQAARLTIGTELTEPIHTGYGLGIQEWGGLLGHNGGILGFSLWMMQDPQTGTTIVVVTNLGTTTGAHGSMASVLIFTGIADLLFPKQGFAALLPPPVATPVP